MRIRPLAFGAAALLSASVATTSLAQGDADKAIAAAMKARQSHMQLYAYNLAVLGGMAQEEIDYDSAMAQAAADNLLALASLDQSRYWPQGSDSDSVEGSRALPALWEDMPGVMSAAEDFSMAVEMMADVAGTDLASLQGAMGDLGAGCGGCHRNFRLRDD
ncbi:MAG: monoheme cytochrome c [Rhodobacteraceae bacterium HLUCCA08]|nr:MAG: monoheme cytochrome c [Rhodobacteraceae bacterium HLUCCA08]